MRPSERSTTRSEQVKGLLRLAQQQAQRGEYAAAVATVRRALSRGADAYTCYLHLAAIEQQRDRPDAAMMALQHALQLQPHRTDAREKMAELYLEAGNVEAAIEQASQVLRYEPDNITVRPLLVAAYLERGDWSAALRVLDDLIARAPNEPMYHFHQAQLFQELGQWGLALVAYDRVVQIGSDPQLVQRAREAINQLDRIQLDQILTLALEDPQFRALLLDQPEEALLNRHFALSREGFAALRLLTVQLQDMELPCKPRLYH